MSKFKPLEFLGSEKEINKIALSTVATLEREFKLRITQEVIIPPVVDCFIDAAIYESLQLMGSSNVRSELNLFELLRIVHELIPGEEQPELVTIISLGRMGMRKLELELPEEEDNVNSTNKIADIDIKLLEQISIRACQYLEDRHGLGIRDYQIVFKIAEVFFDEMISYIKVNTVTDDTLVVFDQFSIILDETGRFESIEINEFLQKTIESLYAGILIEEDRLKREDDEFAENKSK
jgi:hypothetical protein